MVGSVLDGQVAVMVGASSGMGRATARALAAAGAKTVLAARNGEALRSLAAEIGGSSLPVVTDVGDRQSVNRLIEESIGRFGRLDILVYATGTNIPDRSLLVLSDETWNMMLQTNLTGAFWCTTAVLPAMRQQGNGLIIYLSTGAVQKPDVSGVAYQASKHGLSGLAHGTFSEEQQHGIRTTVIFPGLTETPMLARRPTPTPPEVVAMALQPEDVAAACLFVASLPSRARVPEMVLLPSGL